MVTIQYCYSDKSTGYIKRYYNPIIWEREKCENVCIYDVSGA